MPSSAIPQNRNASHAWLEGVFGYLLPDDFPEFDCFDSATLVQTVAQMRMTDAESLVLWCYVKLVSMIDKESIERADIILDALAIRAEDEMDGCRFLAQLQSKAASNTSCAQLIATPPEAITSAITDWVVARLRPYLPKRRALQHISIDEVIHPKDRDQHHLLRTTSGFAKVFDQATDFYRRGHEVLLRGQGILVTHRSSPRLHAAFAEAGRILGFSALPRLYITQGGMMVRTLGVEDPAVVIETMAAGSLDHEELVFVFGRELGRQLTGHLPVKSLVDWLNFGGRSLTTFTAGLSNLLGLRLKSWSRAAELTADRFGYLACQNREATLRVLLKFSGIPGVDYPDLQTRSLVEQAEDFRLNRCSNVLEKTVETLTNLQNETPWTVYRASELCPWMDDIAPALIESFANLTTSRKSRTSCSVATH